MNDISQQVYLEVVQVNMQFLGVQHAQHCVDFLVVILYSPVQTMQNGFPVSCNHLVGSNDSDVVEDSKVAKLPLSPAVDNQAPGDMHAYLPTLKMSMSMHKWSDLFLQL